MVKKEKGLYEKIEELEKVREDAYEEILGQIKQIKEEFNLNIIGKKCHRTTSPFQPTI